MVQFGTQCTWPIARTSFKGVGIRCFHWFLVCCYAFLDFCYRDGFIWGLSPETLPHKYAHDGSIRPSNRMNRFLSLRYGLTSSDVNQSKLRRVVIARGGDNIWQKYELMSSCRLLCLLSKGDWGQWT